MRKLKEDSCLERAPFFPRDPKTYQALSSQAQRGRMVIIIVRRYSSEEITCMFSASKSITAPSAYKLVPLLGK